MAVTKMRAEFEQLAAGTNCIYYTCSIAHNGQRLTSFHVDKMLQRVTPTELYQCNKTVMSLNEE